MVSVTGVTGGRKELPAHLNSWIRQVKEESPLPVCVGFGISSSRQARSISKVADGVIVGSAIIEIIRKGKNSKGIVERTGRFIRSLREGMDGD